MDRYPDEVGWRIVDPVTDTVKAQRVPGTYFVKGEVVQETVSVTEGGDYILEMFDQAGDGICCGHGFGEASVFWGTRTDPDQLLAYTDGRYSEQLQLPFTASSAGIDSGPNPNVGLFLVRIQTDSFPTESSWEIRASNGEVVRHENLHRWDPGSEAIYNIELILGESYLFVVYDSQGDGLCKLHHSLSIHVMLVFTDHHLSIIGCEYGVGFAEVYYGTVPTSEKLLAFTDGEFGQDESIRFVAEDPTMPMGCFPSLASCQVEGRGAVLMKDLKLGDKVLVGEGVYESIYSFGHRLDDSTPRDYLEITIASLKLELSREHMLFVEGRHAIPASSIKIGDAVELSSGESTTVQSVRSVSREGVFAPFTPSGTIVVNGVKCSTFIAFQESETLWIGSMNTRMTFHFLSRVFEAPHRTWCRYYSTCKMERYTESGISTWADAPRIFMIWVLKQHVALQALILLPLCAFFGLVAYPFVLLSVGAAFLMGLRCSLHVQAYRAKSYNTVDDQPCASSRFKVDVV